MGVKVGYAIDARDIDRAQASSCRERFLAARPTRRARACRERSIDSPATPTLGLVGHFFGPDFRPPIPDQLIGQAHAGGKVGEDAARRVYRGAAALNQGALGARGLDHAGHGSAAHARVLAIPGGRNP